MRKYAVYTHKDPETDEIMYVGIASQQPGTSEKSTQQQRFNRAFDKYHSPAGAGRKADHSEWLYESNATITIEHEFECRDECREKESELIKHYQPKFNLTKKCQ